MRRGTLKRSDKTIDSPLYVHTWAKDDYILAGQLTLQEAATANGIAAQFVYIEEYREDPDAYPLDPINLDFTPGIFTTTHPHITLGAIFDAAPDAWGRRVIHANDRNLTAEQTFRSAFLRGADGIGAIVLTSDPLADVTALAKWSQRERPTLKQIDDAAIAARRLEMDGSIPDELKHLLAGSWTIGGARPKAILQDLEARSVIAKFPSLNENVNRNGIEWASLQMARDMGFTVPDHKLISVSTGQALVLGRFDRAGPTQSERLHYVSAYSLISKARESLKMDSAADVAVFSCGNLIDLAGRLATKPAAAKVNMFARLLLNAALHNTDDHLKNFGFLKDPNDALHYSIAPVFDVSPQLSTDHYLHCADIGRNYTAAELLNQAPRLGIAPKAAQAAWDQMMPVLEKRADYYDEAGLTHAEINSVDKLFVQGVGKAGTLKPVVTILKNKSTFHGPTPTLG